MSGRQHDGREDQTDQRFERPHVTEAILQSEAVTGLRVGVLGASMGCIIE